MLSIDGVTSGRWRLAVVLDLDDRMMGWMSYGLEVIRGVSLSRV